MDNSSKVSIDLDFSVVSSWSVNKEIKEAFSCDDYCSSPATEDDEYSFVDMSSCVCLTRPESQDDPPSVKVAVNGSGIIRKLLLLSESPIVEVYGHFEEYLKTVRGTKVEEAEGTVVYGIDIDEVNVKEVSLKFLGLKGATSMWVFGVRLFVSEEGSCSRLDEILAESKLSEKAEKFRKLVSGKINFPKIGSEESKMKASSESVEELKDYIDSSIQQMEQRITDNIHIQISAIEERQNERLDAILKLLKLKTSQTCE